MAKKKIKTMKELQKRLPALLKEHGDNHKLLQAALANPILALEEIDIELSPKVKREITLRARFGGKEAEKIQKLENKIFKEAGKEFDLQSEKDTLNVVKEVLKDTKITDKQIENAVKGNLEPVFFRKEQKGALFTDFSEKPKLLELLDEYYELERSRPRLADKKTFNKVKKEQNLPFSLTNISFHLQEGDQE